MADSSLDLFRSPRVLTGFLVFLLPVAPVLAQGQPSSGGWGTQVESQADYAYRAIYQRSLANRPRNGAAEVAPAKIKPHPRPARAANAAGVRIPDLPTRKPAGLTKAGAPEAPHDVIVIHGSATAPATVASTNGAQTENVATPSGIHPAIGDPWLEPIFSRTGNQDDVLVTGVLGNEEPAGDAARPRDRGDQYCSAVGSAAADARFVWQKQTLRETEEKVKKKIEELQTQIADYKKWMSRRDDFSKRAQTAVTSIYAKMAPDAAALQLTSLDEETAAAVISQLKPAVASAVMAEMDSKKAARLTAILAASSIGPKGKPPVRP